MASFDPQEIQQELQDTYNAIAPDFSASRSTPWPEFQLMAQAVPQGAKLLDLGCGNGRFYEYLTQECGLTIDYTGVDFSSGLLQIARKRFPKIPFVEADIAELELDERFQVISCIAAFHHLPSTALRKTALKRMFDHLEDDGVLMISVWNLWQWRYLKHHLRALLGWFFSGFRADRRGLMVPFGKDKKERYYHAFYRFELKRMLNQASFTVEHFERSRHNMVFFCRKRMAKASSDPVFLNRQQLTDSLRKASPIATCRKSS